MKFVLFFIISFAFSISNYAYSIPEDLKKESIASHGFLYTDKTAKLTVNEVINENYQHLFEPISQKIPNIGYSNSVYWFKIDLTQTYQTEKDYILLLANHSIDNLILYKIENSLVNDIQFVQTGDKLPHLTREIKYREFAFHIKIKNSQKLTLLFRAESQASITLPVYLYDSNFFYQDIKKQETYHGIYYGIILSMLLYNLFIFLATREVSYFFYISYIASLLLLQSTGLGHSYEYLWPGSADWNSIAFSFFIGLTIFFSSLFAKDFLKTVIYATILNRFLMLTTLLGIFISILSFFISIRSANYFATMCGLFTSVLITLAAIKAYRRGYFPARLFLLAWSSFVIGAIFVILKIFGLFPSMLLTEHGVQIGSMIETILLSFALVDKINEMKKANQEIALTTLYLQENSKRELEVKVKERTAELNKYILALNKDLQMAKNIQTSLMPSKTINLKNFTIVSKYIPQDKVGGDYFDIYTFNDNKIRIFIADATGHGVQAALVTMTIKSEYDALKDIILDPAELTETLHQRFLNVYSSMNLFFTSVILDIDLLKEEIVYTSTGHPSQFILRGNSIIELPRTGYIMGLIKDAPVRSESIPFYRGDKIILFTDGLYEEFNSSHEQYGDERLKSGLVQWSTQTMETMIDMILSDIFGYMEDTPAQDDITIIGVESK